MSADIIEARRVVFEHSGNGWWRAYSYDTRKFLGHYRWLTVIVFGFFGIGPNRLKQAERGEI